MWHMAHKSYPLEKNGTNKTHKYWSQVCWLFWADIGAAVAQQLASILAYLLGGHTNQCASDGIYWKQ